MLNQAPDGGIADGLAGEHVSVPDRQPARRLRLDGARQVLPVGARGTTPASSPTTTYQGAALAEFMQSQGIKSVYILNDKEAYGLGVATTTRNAAESLGIKIAGFEAWDPKATSYTSQMQEDQGQRGGRGLPRRPDRRERRPGDQGQGRRPRPERRRGEAARAGRVHAPGHDRRVRDCREGHVHVRRRCADRHLQGPGPRLHRRAPERPAPGQGDRPVRDLRRPGRADPVRRDRRLGRHTGST